MLYRLVSFTALVAMAVSAAAQNECDARKLKCVRKESTCLTKVYEKAQKKGLDPDAAKIDKCMSKFEDPVDGCFAKVEATFGDCSTTNNAGAVDAQIDQDVQDYRTGVTISSLPNKCRAGKLKCMRKKATCLIKAHEKSQKKGLPPDEAKIEKCMVKFEDPSTGCVAKEQVSGNCGSGANIHDLELLVDRGVQDYLTALAISVPGPPRFADNGLTVTDTQTGLEWVKQLDCGAPVQCTDDPTFCSLPLCLQTYNWSDGGSGKTGNAYTLYLAQLNGSVSALLPLPGGGLTSFTTSCFAGHCDWRLPDLGELESIVDCGFLPCIDPIFGPTAAGRYWTDESSSPDNAWSVSFDSGLSGGSHKAFSFFYVRAVR